MFGAGNNAKAKAEVPNDHAGKPDDHQHSSQTDDSEIHDKTPSPKTGRDVVLEGLKGIGGLGNSMAPVAGKSSGVIDESKWCALCERDGHESIDCPFDE
jgi:hypothetical protein